MLGSFFSQSEAFTKTLCFSTSRTNVFPSNLPAPEIVFEPAQWLHAQVLAKVVHVFCSQRAGEKEKEQLTLLTNIWLWYAFASTAVLVTAGNST
jgi:hypothetical protein